MEYQMENKNPRPPCFLIVLDTAMSAEELQDAKDSLGQLVALLPEECLVGLITFGATVTVHELCDGNAFPKSYVLRGTDDVTQDQLKKLLNLELSPSEYASYDKQRGSAVAEASNALRRFILPVSECEFTLQTALDELRPDPFPREPGMRPFRATGVAIAAAQGLIAECHSAQGARVMVFTSGPCTMGPGSIVGRDMSETMRTHQDFNKGSAKHYKAASKFYNQLGIRLATHAHTLDVFACSLDQVGLAEMKTAVDQTGGVMVLAEQFGAEAFRSSLRRMFCQGRLRRAGHVLQRDVLGVLHAARDGVRRHRPDVRARRQEQVHLRERGWHGPDHVVANLLAQLEHLGGGVLRDREPALQPDPLRHPVLPAVLRPVQAKQRGDSAEGHDGGAALGGDVVVARRRVGV